MKKKKNRGILGHRTFYIDIIWKRFKKKKFQKIFVLPSGTVQKRPRGAKIENPKIVQTPVYAPLMYITPIQYHLDGWPLRYSIWQYFFGCAKNIIKPNTVAHV